MYLKWLVMECPLGRERLWKAVKLILMHRSDSSLRDRSSHTAVYLRLVEGGGSEELQLLKDSGRYIHSHMSEFTVFNCQAIFRVEELSLFKTVVDAYSFRGTSGTD